MVASLIDSHLDIINRIKTCVTVNKIVPKLEYICRSTGRKREIRKTAGNSTGDSSQKGTRMLKYDK